MRQAQKKLGKNRDPIYLGEMKKGLSTNCYAGLTQVGTFLGHIVLLIVRLYWGGSLCMAGIGKLMTLGEIATFFETIGLPFPLFTAALVALIEIVGGASLFVGFFSRVISFLLIIFFLVAYLLAHNESLVNLLSNPEDFFIQAPFLYLYASFLIFCFGAGFASFDYWIERKRLGN